MRYFIQTTIPVDEQEPSQGIAVNACDDLDAFGDFVTVKVSARQFERVVSALRAGAVPHLIGTYAPGTVEQTDGTFRETTEKEQTAQAFTILYGAESQEDFYITEEDVAKVVGVTVPELREKIRRGDFPPPTLVKSDT